MYTAIGTCYSVQMAVCCLGWIGTLCCLGWIGTVCFLGWIGTTCWHVSLPDLHVRSRDVSRVDRSVSLRQNSMLNTPNCTRNIT
jgi:hypothetical protein